MIALPLLLIWLAIWLVCRLYTDERDRLRRDRLEREQREYWERHPRPIPPLPSLDLSTMDEDFRRWIIAPVAAAHGATTDEEIERLFMEPASADLGPRPAGAPRTVLTIEHQAD